MVQLESGASQGSILGPLSFLIYLHKKSFRRLTTNASLFADDVSLSSVVNNINLSATDLNSDLSKINAWASQWKMTFNSDPKEQASEVIFLVERKKHHVLHWTLTITLLNNYSFKNTWAVYLDSKLDFRDHLQNISKKVNKTISLLRKLQNNLPRAPLVTIYKSFIMPHLDYKDNLCDQTLNNSFHKRLYSIQYNTALAITGTIRRIPEKNLIKN